MQVILREEVDRLGFPGDVVKVRNGYARNFLLPRGYAVVATPGAMTAHRKQIEARERREETERAAFEELARSLNGKKITLTKRAGSKMKLYGSVTVREVQDAIKEQLGVEIERRRLAYDETIKTLGEHERTVRIARDITATFVVEVLREGTEEEEAEAPAANAEAAVQTGEEAPKAPEVQATEEPAAEAEEAGEAE